MYWRFNVRADYETASKYVLPLQYSYPYYCKVFQVQQESLLLSTPGRKICLVIFRVILAANQMRMFPAAMNYATPNLSILFI